MLYQSSYKRNDEFTLLKTGCHVAMTGMTMLALNKWIYRKNCYYFLNVLSSYIKSYRTHFSVQTQKIKKIHSEEIFS